MGTQRLFLFASYDKYNCVDHMLVHYLNALSKLGDIVFVMDNPLTADEMEKITTIPNVLYAQAERHGEYDFGSYKRAYQWARKNKLFSKYDWIYFVNDSVLGPLFDLEPVLQRLESNGADVVGMYENKDNVDILDHIQSWFIGLTSNVAQTDNVAKFMAYVRKLPDKMLIVQKYEVGFSQMLKHMGLTFVTTNGGPGCNDLYSKPSENIKAGVPFVKKNCNWQLSQDVLADLQQKSPDLKQELLFWLFCNQKGIASPASNMRKYHKVLDVKIFNCLLIWRIYSRDAWGVRKDKYYLFGLIPLFSMSKR